MRDFSEDILELIRRTSTDLPNHVEDRLKMAMENGEAGSAARSSP